MRGTSTSEVEVCLPNGNIERDIATIDAEIEWQVSLLARISLIEGRLGPFKAYTGIEGGLTHADVRIGNGVGTSARFDVNEAFRSNSAVLGWFAAIKCEVYGVSLSVVLDAAIAGFGDSSWSHDVLGGSFGVGAGF